VTSLVDGLLESLECREFTGVIKLLWEIRCRKKSKSKLT